MHQARRPGWQVILVALVGLWGLVLIVLTAFLLAMSTVGQEFSVAALGTGIAVGIGAIITLLPVLAWLRDHGAKRLWPTVAPGLLSLVAVTAWFAYLALQPSVGP